MASRLFSPRLSSLRSPTPKTTQRTWSALLYTCLILAATLYVFRIAVTTPFDVHPDEVNHADAYCYYESHWWPPPLNADGLRYSPYGMSRLHEEEVVYVIFGKVALLLRPLVEPFFHTELAPAVSVPSTPARLFLPRITAPSFCFVAYHTYRLLNVALLAVMLAMLFGVALWGKGLLRRWSANLGLLILAIPQAVYLYGYANSDGWGLAISCLLLLTSLSYDDSVRWRWRDVLWLGLLTGLVLLSKRTFWLVLPLAYLIMAIKGINFWRADRAGLIKRLLLVGALALVLIAPMKIVYPLSQGDYRAGILAMREQRARADIRPSSSTYPGYQLAPKGYPFHTVWADSTWWRDSFMSAYAVFGYWSHAAPLWVYSSAGLLLLLGAGCTVIDFTRRRAAYSLLARVALLAAPFLIAAILISSLLYSWLFDFQPQGRYLLPAILPLAVLVGGAAEDEPRWLRIVRSLIWLPLLAISFTTLWNALLSMPTWQQG